MNDDMRSLLKHLTPRNLLMALVVLTAWAVAIRRIRSWGSSPGPPFRFRTERCR